MRDGRVEKEGGGTGSTPTRGAAKVSNDRRGQGDLRNAPGRTRAKIFIWICGAPPRISARAGRGPVHRVGAGRCYRRRTTTAAVAARVRV